VGACRARLTATSTPSADLVQVIVTGSACDRLPYVFTTCNLEWEGCTNHGNFQP
jgi:hypothetical protein